MGLERTSSPFLPQEVRFYCAKINAVSTSFYFVGHLPRARTQPSCQDGLKGPKLMIISRNATYYIRYNRTFGLVTVQTDLMSFRVRSIILTDFGADSDSNFWVRVRSEVRRTDSSGLYVRGNSNLYYCRQMQ